MAADWFVYFDKKGQKVPSKEDVGKALEDFLGAYATEVKWDRDRFYAKLVGTKSWPFKRLEPADSVIALGMAEREGEDRWIEVWLDDECIDVMTRSSDEATNNLAEGFAKLIARYWKGRKQFG